MIVELSSYPPILLGWTAVGGVNANERVSRDDWKKSNKNNV